MDHDPAPNRQAGHDRHPDRVAERLSQPPGGNVAGHLHHLAAVRPGHGDQHRGVPLAGIGGRPVGNPEDPGSGGHHVVGRNRRFTVDPVA
jgi:hypothetical protein